MFYRMHASIINIFLKNPDKIDYALIEDYLDRAEKSPFAVGVNIKSTDKVSKEEPSVGKLFTLVNIFVFCVS